MKQYRQGDVLLIAIDNIPKNLKTVPRDNGRVVLAYGELTGHAHAIHDSGVTLFRDPKLAAVFMEVTGDAPVMLEHEEHGTIEIPPGDYRIVHQREYTPEEIRRVAD